MTTAPACSDPFQAAPGQAETSWDPRPPTAQEFRPPGRHARNRSGLQMRIKATRPAHDRALVFKFRRIQVYETRVK
jgi:hypothetical protein